MSATVFGKLPNGSEAKLYTIKNSSGMTAVVTDYGCRVIKLLTQDKHGEFGDVVLGHRTLEEYFGSNFQGSFVGRYANRIGNAEFTLDGVVYKLAKNDGENTLHGGPTGYHQVVWNVSSVSDNSISFTHVSPDGDEGYPGKVELCVSYTVSEDNELVMSYSAVSDKGTPFNPTNHSYFNLSADGQKEVLGTFVTINASKVTNVKPGLIPDGTFREVAGGPLDFTKPKKLGDDMFDDDAIIKACGGFDHNFCVDGEGFRKFAEAYEPESGRVMEVWSDMPGVQLYTANTVGGEIGKDGKPMIPHGAFCLETQFYPDTPNHDNFPSCIIKAGEKFTTKTVYRFSVK